MSKKKANSPQKGIIVRHYEPGDEAPILDFLNLCYGEWGTIQKWRSRYTEYPTFQKDNIVLMQVNDEIVGHGSIHYRDLIVWKRKLHTASLTDAAIHPHYRGRKHYARMVDTRLKLARARGACLAFTWHLKGSDAYNHNKRIGFTEVKQSPVYMKIIKPGKVIKSGLFDLLHKNQRLKEALQELEVDLSFRVGESKFSITDLLGKADKKPRKNRNKVEIVLNNHSLYVIANFRSMSKFKRMVSLIMLILSRKAKIRFSSLKALLNLAHKGVAIIGTI